MRLKHLKLDSGAEVTLQTAWH